MKSIVIDYSQTGNTRKVAKENRHGMEQNAGQCDAAQVKDPDPSDVDQLDLIGLGSPVWHNFSVIAPRKKQPPRLSLQAV